MIQSRTFVRVTIPYGGDHEELIAQLDGVGFLGAEYDAGSLILWFDPTTMNTSSLSSWLAERLGSLAEHVQIQQVDSEDWLAQWRSTLHPVTIAERVTILPFGNTEQQNEICLTLSIEPRMAFGTGHHATTQLCIEFLLETVRPGQVWIDLGTGSGLLAIVAAKLGASHVIAIDNDPDAIEEAQDNAEKNSCVSKIEFQCADILQKELPSCDGIVANLHADLLQQLNNRITHPLKDGGVVIVSGILACESSMVLAPYTQNGMALLKQRTVGEWAALLLQNR
jgi:ribosomal protein L11 methyltransferase